MVDGALLIDGDADMLGIFKLGAPLGALDCEGWELMVGPATIVGLALLLGELELLGAPLGALDCEG